MAKVFASVGLYEQIMHVSHKRTNTIHYIHTPYKYTHLLTHSQTIYHFCPALDSPNSSDVWVKPLRATRYLLCKSRDRSPTVCVAFSSQRQPVFCCHTVCTWASPAPALSINPPGLSTTESSRVTPPAAFAQITCHTTGGVWWISSVCVFVCVSGLWPYHMWMCLNLPKVSFE